MSNWHHLVCHSHNPPIESEDEVTQHTRHVGAILPAIAKARKATPGLREEHGQYDLRDRLRNYVAAFAPDCLLPHQVDGIARFLAVHAQCELRLENESGIETPLPPPHGGSMTNIDHAADIIERATRGAHTADGHHMKMRDHTAQIIAESLADAGLLTPDPQIIRTRDELADLDPDTLVAMNPITKGHATAYVWSADTALRVNLLWHAPMVIIATGDHVRAARQALEKE